LPVAGKGFEAIKNIPVKQQAYSRHY
jgi:hypothetical protein